MIEIEEGKVYRTRNLNGTATIIERFNDLWYVRYVGKHHRKPVFGYMTDLGKRITMDGHDPINPKTGCRDYRDDLVASVEIKVPLRAYKKREK